MGWADWKQYCRDNHIIKYLSDEEYAFGSLTAVDGGPVQGALKSFFLNHKKNGKAVHTVEDKKWMLI
jgi:hypothetical protein